ncbi:MAG TPA: cell division protein FtsA [bacterium]|nr:cell division protein FtsA [bacterium]
MAKELKQDVVVGLDLGTTKVCTIIGELDDEGQVHIIGVGTTPSTGLKKGSVVNIEQTINSIKKSIHDAERMAGVEVGSVFAGVAGGHIKGLNSRGVIAVSRRDKEITEEDRERVIEAAQAIAIPLDREIIHVIPQEYIVDDQDGIKNPVGMSGVRLEAEVHVVTGAVTSVQNIVRSVERAGVAVNDIVLQPLASAEAILSADEKELGVVLIDIGGGTTDIAVFINGSLWHTGIITLGGALVTSDVAVGLRTPNTEAESIKTQFGSAYTAMVKEEEEITVPGVGGRPDRRMPRRVLSEIIEARMEEIFELVAAELKKHGFEDRVPAGAVITGGSALMEGTAELAEKILQLPVRIGSPKRVGGLTDVVSNPMYSTAVGLVLMGLKSHPSPSSASPKKGGGPGALPGAGMFQDILGRMKSWFGDSI